MSRVLVVDDEKNILATLSIGLKRSDYPVLQARSGPEALKILDSNPCDIVVSDIRMSPMDGYTLAKKIHDKHPQVSIVLMSAYGFDDWKPNHEDVSQYPRLVKPFEVSELIAVLKQEEAKKKDVQAANASFKKNLLYIGDAKQVAEFQELVEAAGGKLIDVASITEFQEQIKKKTHDAFVVDNDLISNDIGKVLNLIDQLAVDKSVFLLTTKTGEKESARLTDEKVIVFDREAFLNNPHWALEQLKSYLND